MIYLSGAPVAWKSRAQTTVALSSCEAEYMAAADGVKEICWLANLLKELQFGLKLPILLYTDNQGSICLAKNAGSQHQRTKHIDIRHHFIRDKIQAGLVKLDYIPTDQMPADALTKNLNRAKFIAITKLFMDDPDLN
jgi:hypothetical protein